MISFDTGPNPDRGTLESAPDGTLYLCDAYNFRLRKIDAATGIITTIAGGGTQPDNNIPGTTAQIQCNGVVLAPDGSLYFSEFPRIRKLDRNGIQNLGCPKGCVAVDVEETRMDSRDEVFLVRRTVDHILTGYRAVETAENARHPTAAFPAVPTAPTAARAVSVVAPMLYKPPEQIVRFRHPLLHTL